MPLTDTSGALFFFDIEHSVRGCIFAGDPHGRDHLLQTGFLCRDDIIGQ